MAGFIEPAPNVNVVGVVESVNLLLLSTPRNCDIPPTTTFKLPVVNERYVHIIVKAEFVVLPEKGVGSMINSPAGVVQSM